MTTEEKLSVALNALRNIRETAQKSQSQDPTNSGTMSILALANGALRHLSKK